MITQSKQSYWVRDFISYLIEQRRIAKSQKNSYGDIVFKLMANSFFGYTILSVRKGVNIRIKNSKNVRSYDKLISNIRKNVFIHSFSFPNNIK